MHDLSISALTPAHEKGLLRQIREGDPWHGLSCQYFRWSGLALCRVYAATIGDLCVGYAALSVTSVKKKDLPRSQVPQPMPPPVFPAVYLGGLFVVESARRSGVARRLIQLACATGLNLRSVVGCRLVLTKPYDDAAAGLYERFEFRHLKSEASMMYLPLQ